MAASYPNQWQIVSMMPQGSADDGGYGIIPRRMIRLVTHLLKVRFGRRWIPDYVLWTYLMTRPFCRMTSDGGKPPTYWFSTQDAMNQTALSENSVRRAKADLVEIGCLVERGGRRYEFRQLPREFMDESGMRMSDEAIAMLDENADDDSLTENLRTMLIASGSGRPWSI